jgi:hypothetical protein
MGRAEGLRVLVVSFEEVLVAWKWLVGVLERKLNKTTPENQST